MLDRLVLHGYGVHQAVRGREGVEVEQHCGLSVDGMEHWCCWNSYPGVDVVGIGRARLSQG